MKSSIVWFLWKGLNCLCSNPGSTTYLCVAFYFCGYEVGKTAPPSYSYYDVYSANVKTAVEKHGISISTNISISTSSSTAVVKDNEDKLITSALTMFFQEVTPSYSVLSSSS